jgi:hypothetical protein
MKSKLLTLALLAASSAFAGTHVFFGVGVGGPGYYAPPPPPPVAYYAVPAPGPDYAWINGYYYPAGPRWAWRPGYWGRRPYVGAYWAPPRYYRGNYSRGYWHR